MPIMCDICNSWNCEDNGKKYMCKYENVRTLMDAGLPLPVAGADGRPERRGG